MISVQPTTFIGRSDAHTLVVHTRLAGRLLEHVALIECHLVVIRLIRVGHVSLRCLKAPSKLFFEPACQTNCFQTDAGLRLATFAR